MTDIEHLCNALFGEPERYKTLAQLDKHLACLDRGTYILAPHQYEALAKRGGKVAKWLLVLRLTGKLEFRDEWICSDVTVPSATRKGRSHDAR